MRYININVQTQVYNIKDAQRKILTNILTTKIQLYLIFVPSIKNTTTWSLKSVVVIALITLISLVDS